METTDTDPSLKKEDRLKFSNYQTLANLGEGTYGKVYLVKYIPDGRPYALKIFKNIGNMQAMFEKEVASLRKVEGVNQCAQLFAALDMFKEKYRGLTMEFYRGGELLKYIMSKRGLEEEDVRKYLREIVSVLEKLQSLRLAHLDIKAENFFLDKDLNLTLGDFGMCEEIPHNTENISDYRKGSPSYQLPEMIQQQPYNPFQADIYAAGVTVFSIYSCLLPFKQAQSYSILVSNPGGFWKLMQKNSPNPAFQDNLNKDFVDLFTKMVHPNKSQRITLEKIKEHPFYLGISENTPTLKETLAKINSELNHFQAQESSEMQTEQQLTRGHCQESIQEKFEIYEYQVSNLLANRQAKIYSEEIGRLCDFWTNIDCLTLFKFLFVRQEEFTSEIPQLSSKSYKLKCVFKPAQEPSEIENTDPIQLEDINFSISLQSNQENTRTYVLFSKKSGDSFEFFKLIASIQNIVKSFK